LPVLLEAFNQFMKEYNNEKQNVQFQIMVVRKQLDQLTREMQSNSDTKNLYSEGINELIKKTCILSREIIKLQEREKPKYNTFNIESTKEKIKNLLIFRRKFYFGMGSLMALFISCALVGAALIISSENEIYAGVIMSIEHNSFLLNSTNKQGIGHPTGAVPIVPDPKVPTTTTQNQSSGIQGFSNNFLVGILLLVIGVAGFVSTTVITFIVYKRERKSISNMENNMKT